MVTFVHNFCLAPLVSPKCWVKRGPNGHCCGWLHLNLDLAMQTCGIHKSPDREAQFSPAGATDVPKNYPTATEKQDVESL